MTVTKAPIITPAGSFHPESLIEPNLPSAGRIASRPLRIAMVGLRGIPATYGGVEKAVEGLAVRLAQRGHDVTVYGRRAYCDSSLESFEGVRLRYLPQINTKHLEAISHTALALAAVLRAGDYDLVHIHATGPALLSFIPLLGKLPTVATVQGLDFRREKWGAMARATLKVAAYASAKVPTKTIVVSRELQRHFAEAYGADTVYIPNGVDLEGLADEAPVDGLRADDYLLYLGRLVPEKHVHTLISAYERAGISRPLVIAGPSSHSDDYVALLHKQAAGVEGVRFVGPRYGAEKAWLLSNASAFIQPSSIEGLPIALLEALAAGAFPIVSDIPENLEPVTTATGRLGLSCSVGDPDDLAERLAEAVSRPDRGEHTTRLQEHVRMAYAWDSIARQTESVYYEAVAA